LRFITNYRGGDVMLKELIKSCPGFIEKPARYIHASIPDYIRCGKIFRNQYKFLKQSQWWTKEQHEEYQMVQLNRLLEHAYKNVPYYTRVFDERGLKPKDIKSFSDLKKLPYLTREIIKDNLKDLVARNYNPKKLKVDSSSGTIKTPVNFYIEPKVVKALEWAFISRLWSCVGYNAKKINRCVIIRGNIPQNGVYEYKGRDLILSSYRMTEENMRRYIELMESFNPDFIQAYPSSIHLISKYILRNNIKLNLLKLKCILCSSENLYEDQKPEIENAFGVRVYNHYGHSEQACLAGWCEQRDYFHIQSEYGYTEIINEFGQDVCGEEEVGEVVATGFNNYVMPFIRYRTGDLVVNTNEKCSCGRNYKLIKKIEGRSQEFLVDEALTLMPASWAVFATKCIREKISGFQYVQNQPGKLVLNIQYHEIILDEEIKVVRKVFHSYYPGIELEINFVEHIERTIRGKYKYLVQRLDVEKYK
jgi:phenylacetate-CoA ligase